MSRHTQGAVLGHVIGAIGEADFAAVTARSLLAWLDFDLATVVVHRRDAKPALMFDNFDSAGGTQGVRNYVSVTHCLNPVLQFFNRPGVFRARDFRIGGQGIGAGLRRYLIENPDEELGYRTVGWPQRLEEIGLYFEACHGVVELGLYRERGARGLSANRLHELEVLRAPIAAAFERQWTLFGRLPQRSRAEPKPQLSRREHEVTGLLLSGCGSEAIALRLGISCHTVKDHRKQIFRKLGVGTLAELFALYRERD
jgi:DNA-binding CsgD family transcriptional regulator